MNFEEFARDSGRALADAAAQLRPPTLTEISSRRRRTTLAAGAAGVAALLLGAVAVAGSINRVGPAVTPPTSDSPASTMVAEEAPVTVIDLLDGSRLEVIGPDLELTGYLFFLERPELGGTTNVYLNPVDDPAEAAATESAELEADLGGGVQLWRGDREGQPLFMSVDLDGWIVFLHVGSDASPNSEDLLALAAELRGEVTEYGVIMPNHDTDSFTTYLGSPGSENSIHLGIGECLREVIPGSEIVEHPARGEVIQGDTYASWCDDANDLEVRVHGDGGFVVLSVGELTLRRSYPNPQRTTTSTAPPSTTSTTTLASTEPTVSPVPIDQDVSLRVLAVRPNNPSLAVIDLAEGTTTIYPPGAHAMPLDATDGAVATPEGDWIIWTSGVASLFAGPLDQVDLVLGPKPPRHITGYAPALRVVPTPDADRAWLVQPGITYGQDHHPTLVDLVGVPDGSPLLSIETEGSAFPVAATDAGLVLNVHDWLDTGDGFVTEPGTELVVHMLDDGTTVPVGEGRAIAASPTRVVRIASDRLLVSGPDGSGEVEVVKPFDGTWMQVGGPMIPSDAMPFQTVSPDGSEVLVRLGRELDVNGTPADSELLAVNLSDGSTRRIAESNGETPLATWSSDGQWIALFWRNDITLINSADTGTQLLLEEVIPEDHFPLAAG